MAVRAHERQIADLRFLFLSKGDDGLRVMALDKSVAAITVDDSKIEITGFSCQLAVLL